MKLKMWQQKLLNFVKLSVRTIHNVLIGPICLMKPNHVTWNLLKEVKCQHATMLHLDQSFVKIVSIQIIEVNNNNFCFWNEKKFSSYWKLISFKSLLLYQWQHSAWMVLVVSLTTVLVFVVTKAVDTVVALVVIIYLVAFQNVVKMKSLKVVLFAKQNLTQDVLYQVNLAFVFSKYYEDTTLT